MVSYQLFHHGIQFSIRTGKYFSLFSLEHHTRYSFTLVGDPLKPRSGLL